MIRHLSERHRVTVASLARSFEEESEGRGLEAYAADILVGRVSEPWQTLKMVSRLPSSTPSSMGYFHSEELKQKIQKACEERAFDLVFVHCSSVAQYATDLEGVPKILDFGDMDSQKWLTYARVRRWPLTMGYWIEGRKLEREERRLASLFDLCTCTTLMELETLRSYRTPADTDWFPNGVDAEYFAPGDSPYDPNLICFVGRMDYYPNQQCMFDFCERIFPLVRKRRPGTKLVIIGASPSAAVRRLADRPGVSVTGSVSDVRPYVRRAALMVAPLAIARGTQNKILEAMAMGVPTVTSELAAKGLDAVPGLHLLTAREPEEYASAIERVLTDPAERDRLARSGRERVLSHHDWRNSMIRMEGIIARCMEKFHAAERRSAS
jgi:hypothetical protein